LVKYIKDAALMLLIGLSILIALNVGAWLYLTSAGQNDRGWKARWQVDAQSRQGISLRKQVLQTQDTDYLASLDTAPVLRPHTVLQFTSGLSTKAYTVGIEGIRYEANWTDEFVERKLVDGNSVFVFGGSTVFGHGVAAENTLAHFLGEQDPKHTYLNFGVNAYDSLRELDKLLYLLRQGYRPRAVIFVDGLNDITTFSSTPYRAVDKPRTQGFMIDRGELALNFGSPVLRNMVMAFAYAMPLTHLYFQLVEEDPGIQYGSLDANVDPLKHRNLSWYYKNQFDYADQNIDHIVNDWVGYYKGHTEFVRQLAKAFGFDVYFVFQPFGVVDKDNPFLNPSYFGSSGASTAAAFTQGAADAINAGELNMIDCQNAFASIDRTLAYVDATHYSPQGNKALAACVVHSIAP
jgi:hypothetical protein